MMASVLPTMLTPTHLLRSQRPPFIAESACGTLRASAHSSAMPCSAAATVLAVGALTTRHPTSEAAARSTLSMPTPARPTTLSRPLLASNTSRVICSSGGGQRGCRGGGGGGRGGGKRM